MPRRRDSVHKTRGRRRSSPASVIRTRHSAEKSYLGFGRSGGRAASDRGLIRRRGPIGGGTACNELPQLGQNSKPAFGPDRCARSQCPRAEQSWLIHCTVQPGKYCMLLPPVVAAGENGNRRAAEAAKIPDCCAGLQWCQEQTTQDIGVEFPGCGFPVKPKRQD